MSIQLLKKPIKKNTIIGIATAFVLLLIGVGYTANIKTNERKKLEEACTTNNNVDDCQKACGEEKDTLACLLIVEIYQDEKDDPKVAHYAKSM